MLDVLHVKVPHMMALMAVPTNIRNVNESLDYEGFMTTLCIMISAVRAPEIIIRSIKR